MNTKFVIGLSPVHDSADKKQKLESRYDKLSGEVKFDLNDNKMDKGQNLGETLIKETKEKRKKHQTIPTDTLSGEEGTMLNTNKETGNDLKDMGKTGQKLGVNLINVLRTAFTLIDSKSVKKIQLSHQYLFMLLGSVLVKAS